MQTWNEALARVLADARAQVQQYGSEQSLLAAVDNASEAQVAAQTELVHAIETLAAEPEIDSAVYRLGLATMKLKAAREALDWLHYTEVTARGVEIGGVFVVGDK